MAKKRTRKEKQNVHHNFKLSWNPASSYARVKGQINIGSQGKISRTAEAKNADLLAQDAIAGTIKHNLVKSLILISLILCLELVIYSLWNK